MTHEIHETAATLHLAAEDVATLKKAEWQAFFETVRHDTGVAHVNDCADADAQSRLIGRASEILGRFAGFRGVATELEGAGGIISALDAFNGASDPNTRAHANVVLANVAPREGEAAKRHENGSPFCFFWHNGTLVVSTVDGLTLSLVKKLGLADTVAVLDTRAALAAFKEDGMISPAEEERIGHAQFRSFEFSPRAAAYVLRYGAIPGAVEKPVAELPDAPQAIWLVDDFAGKYGNCKTTIFPQEVFPPDVVSRLKTGEAGKITTLATAFGEFGVFSALKNAPEGELAVIVGSSGYGENRFLEIVVKGGNAGKLLNAKSGDAVFPNTSGSIAR